MPSSPLQGSILSNDCLMFCQKRRIAKGSFTGPVQKTQIVDGIERTICYLAFPLSKEGTCFLSYLFHLYLPFFCDVNHFWRKRVLHTQTRWWMELPQKGTRAHTRIHQGIIERQIEISRTWCVIGATKGEHFSGCFVGDQNDDRHGHCCHTTHTHGTLMPGESPGDHLGLDAVPKVIDALANEGGADSCDDSL